MSSPAASQFVDIDDDGDEDLVVSSTDFSDAGWTPRLWVIENTGAQLGGRKSASFEMPSEFSLLCPVRGAGGRGFVAAAATFTETGELSTQVYEIRGEAGWVFSEAREVASLENSLPTHIGDVDGDGVVDVVVQTDRKSDAGSWGVRVLYGDGVGGYAEAWYPDGDAPAEHQSVDAGWAYETLEQVHGVDCGDVDEDGHTDAVIWTEARVSVALWDAGHFVAAGDYDQRVGFPYLVDVDGDRHLDLVTRNGAWMSLRRGDGCGGFGPVVSEFALEQEGVLHWVDVNGDGFADIANEGHYYTTVNLNSGSLWGASLIPYHGALPIDVCDVDHDADLDLLTSGRAGVEVLSNESGGAFLCCPWPWNLEEVGFGEWGPVASATTRTATYVLGEPHVTREWWEDVPDEVAMKVWALPLSEASPASWEADPQTLPILCQGDFDGDCEEDVVWAQPDILTVLWSGSERADYAWPVGEIGLFARGNRDADDKPELAVIAYAGSTSVVWASLAGRTLAVSAPVLDLSVLPQAVVAGDLNLDGLDDIVVAGLVLSASGDAEDPEIAVDGIQLDVCLSTGVTRKLRPEKFPAGDALWSYGALALGDLTRDGINDLAMSSVSGAGVLVLPGEGDGSFAAGFAIPVPVGPLWICDLDGNGQAELVSAVEQELGCAWIWWNGGPE